MNTPANQPLITILMCTYNGEKFLAEQLDSFLAQDYKNISLWVSDDGSNDGTMIILKQYQAKFPKGRMTIIEGPKKGFVMNFLSLLCQKDLKSDYYAFSDQDDIWEQEKLSRAFEKIKNITDKPVLYGSRTKTVTEHGEVIGFSSVFARTPCFKNALVQSLAGGNTMLLNQEATNILRKAGTVDVVSHDWWAYMMVSGAGGKVVYDTYAGLLYRQHENNQIGANNGWIARSKRIHLLLQGRFRNWNTQNINALFKVKHLLTAENQAILKKFEHARNSSFFARIIGLWKLGIFRQTILGNLGLIAAIILKKL